LTVQADKETKDAMEDGHHGHSTMSSRMVLQLNKLTHTLEEPDLAEFKEVPSKLPVTPLSQPTTVTVPTLLYKDSHYQSVLMLQTGQATNQESSPTVPLKLITPS